MGPKKTRIFSKNRLFLAIFLFLIVSAFGQKEDTSFESAFGLSDSNDNSEAIVDEEAPSSDDKIQLAVSHPKLTEDLDHASSESTPQIEHLDEKLNEETGNPEDDESARDLQENDEEGSRQGNPPLISGRMGSARSGKYVSYGEFSLSMGVTQSIFHTIFNLSTFLCTFELFVSSHFSTLK